MPKKKTNKSVAKRMEVTKTGKVMRRSMSAQHLTQGKSKRSLRSAGRKVQTTKAQAKKIKLMV